MLGTADNMESTGESEGNPAVIQGKELASRNDIAKEAKSVFRVRRTPRSILGGCSKAAALEINK